MNTINNISGRQSFEFSRQMFWNALRDKFPDGDLGDQKCTAWVNGLELTMGEIRLEVELSATQNIFTFGVTPNQNNTNSFTFPTERRLPLQDSICGTSAQLFIMKPSSRTATDCQLRTYGNIVDFTAAAALSLDQTFYSHGNFTFKRNNKVLVPYWGLKNWWYRGETQQTAAVGAGSPGDQIRGCVDGANAEEPNLVFIGTSNNIPQIELPTNMGTVDAFTRAVLVIQGPYAQNSTSVN